MQQIGSRELAQYLQGKFDWLKTYIKSHPLPDIFSAPHIDPKMRAKEAAKLVLPVLKNPKGLILMRQSMYRNTKTIPIPPEAHAYSLSDSAHPMLFINAQQNLEEQTQLFLIGIIRLMMDMDGFYSSIFDNSIKESYAEKVYYEVRDMAGSEEFLKPVRENDVLREREDSLGALFLQAVSNAVYEGKLSNREAADLIDVSERTLVSLFP